MIGQKSIGRRLLTQTFFGPRFEDHGLSVDVLNELVSLKKIIAEIAVELWRQANPERQRLPAGFESDFDLKFYSVEAGSSCVTLYRIQVQNQLQLNLSAEAGIPVEDEYDRAAGLMQRSFQAVADDALLPNDLPKSVIAAFSQLGKSLNDGEGFYISTPSNETPVLFNQSIRDQLINRQPEYYVDRIEIVGQIREADIDRNHFRMLTETGERIEGNFSDTKQEMILSGLYQHESRGIRLIATGIFGAHDKKLIRISEIEDFFLVIPEDEHVRTEKSLIDKFAEISDSIPLSEWERLPDDLSLKFDKYMYD